MSDSFKRGVQRHHRKLNAELARDFAQRLDTPTLVRLTVAMAKFPERGRAREDAIREALGLPDAA